MNRVARVRQVKDVLRRMAKVLQRWILRIVLIKRARILKRLIDIQMDFSQTSILTLSVGGLLELFGSEVA